MEFLQANLDYLVLGTLGLMSFIMLALVIERYLYLNRVKVQQFDHIETLKIDLTRNRISWVSPLARALLKAREGDCVLLRGEEIEVIAIRYTALD